jgi:hypothetical protein
MASEQEGVELQGDLVEDYIIKGLLKLTMWIPGDLGARLQLIKKLYSTLKYAKYFFSWQSNWKTRNSNYQFKISYQG